MTTLAQFEQEYSGQSLLWDPTPTRAYLRGECVQAACFYVDAVWHLPILWMDAVRWFTSGADNDKYARVPFTGSNRPPMGALIVFGGNLPGSGGSGHICINLSAPANSATFLSLDQNWGGRTLHRVTHNWQYVIGWIVPRQQVTPPEPIVNGGPEMIANSDQAVKMYQMLRPNGGGSQGEIAATVRRRSFAQFLSDAQPEINARNVNLKNQAAKLQQLQGTIDQLNQTVTQVQGQDISDKAALAASLAKITSLTTDLSTARDQLHDLQLKLNTAPDAATLTANATQPNASFFTKFLAVLLAKR